MVFLRVENLKNLSGFFEKFMYWARKYGVHRRHLKPEIYVSPSVMLLGLTKSISDE